MDYIDNIKANTYPIILISLSLLIALLSVYNPSPLTTNHTFDPFEATIDTIHTALYSHQTTCRYIVESYISRIVQLNPHINAIITLNPNALYIADSLDVILHNSNNDTDKLGALFCIPILVKDNYNTYDMPTTGGSLALNGSQTLYDAPTIYALRKAGAVVLGKSNLHELSLDGLSVSSLGGQTRNPYVKQNTHIILHNTIINT